MFTHLKSQKQGAMSPDLCISLVAKTETFALLLNTLHFASALNTSILLLLTVRNSRCHKTAPNDDLQGLCLGETGFSWTAPRQIPLLFLWMAVDRDRQHWWYFNVFWETQTECILNTMVYLTSYLQRAILCALHYVSVLSIKQHFWRARSVFIYMIVY